MTFELGKQYIVEVTENGIIPVEEFKRERFFDKDNDSLNFLTDEEKTVVINEILDKIRTEIEKKYARAKQINSVLQMNAYTDCLQIIDKYKKGKEDKNYIEEMEK